MSRAAVLLSLSSLALVACASASDENTSDTGQTGDELTVGVTCTHSNLSSSDCADMKAAVLSAAPASRQQVFARAFDWISAGVMYSQTSYHAGWRQDCSGFVSMAWQESTSYTTAGYAPYATSVSKELGSYEDLVPGDALNKDPRGHIVLFGAWADSAHDQMIILEESHTGTPAMMKIVAKSYFDGFVPIRATKLPITAGTPASGAPGSGGTSPGSASSGGASCSSDGDCNPGNDGAGKICVSGACAPGCHTSDQCPGSTTCVSGKCQ
jgi:uncharacterized protein YcfL